MVNRFIKICLFITLLSSSFSLASPQPRLENFHKITSTVLKPVYAPLAKEIRAKQNKNGKGLKYDVNRTAETMKSIMLELNIRNFNIIIPQPPGSENIKYGLWLEFHKPDKI